MLWPEHGRLYETTGVGQNLVLIQAGVNDVQKGRCQNLRRQDKVGSNLKEITAMVHVVICCIPKVRGQSTKTEWRVVEANQMIK